MSLTTAGGLVAVVLEDFVFLDRVEAMLGGADGTIVRCRAWYSLGKGSPNCWSPTTVEDGALERLEAFDPMEDTRPGSGLLLLFALVATEARDFSDGERYLMDLER